MRERVRAVAVEVSAQALTSNRVDGLMFDVVASRASAMRPIRMTISAWTSTSRRNRLLRRRRGKRGVVSLDTAWGQKVVDRSRIPSPQSHRRTASRAKVECSILDERASGVESPALTGPEGRSITSHVPLIGRHMAATALAIVMLVEAGF
jgi:UDP-N-acetylmuramoyl-L-alanyl-D-glutamate--2,6-diaminopimelate ligase